MKKKLVAAAFLVVVGFPWIAADGQTLGVASIQLYTIQEGQDSQQSPVCPGRPFFVQPTETDMTNTGLSLEVLCVVVGTYLDRDLPSPSESPDLLRRYLEQPPYAALSDRAYLAVMEEAVQLWPTSRFAHVGLAQAILRGRAEPTSTEKRRAAPEYLKAAEIALAEGKVRYGPQIADLLGDLGDRDGLHRYLERALAITPQEEERSVLYLDFGRALGKAGDERAETYLKKAIESRPEGTWGAYEVYITFLFDQGRPKDVLDLLSPQFEAERVVEPRYLHLMRCRALQRLGRQGEAEVECRQRERRARMSECLLVGFRAVAPGEPDESLARNGNSCVCDQWPYCGWGPCELVVRAVRASGVVCHRCAGSQCDCGGGHHRYSSCHAGKLVPCTSRGKIQARGHSAAVTEGDAARSMTFTANASAAHAI
jgi:hypothetical protein